MCVCLWEILFGWGRHGGRQPGFGRYTAKWNDADAGIFFRHASKHVENHSRNLHILLCEKHFSNALKKGYISRNFAVCFYLRHFKP